MRCRYRVPRGLADTQGNARGCVVLGGLIKEESFLDSSVEVVLSFLQQHTFYIIL